MYNGPKLTAGDDPDDAYVVQVPDPITKQPVPVLVNPQDNTVYSIGGNAIPPNETLSMQEHQSEAVSLQGSLPDTNQPPDIRLVGSYTDWWWHQNDIQVHPSNGIVRTVSDTVRHWYTKVAMYARIQASVQHDPYATEVLLRVMHEDIPEGTDVEQWLKRMAQWGENPDKDNEILDLLRQVLTIDLEASESELSARAGSFVNQRVQLLNREQGSTDETSNDEAIRYQQQFLYDTYGVTIEGDHDMSEDLYYDIALRNYEEGLELVATFFADQLGLEDLSYIEKASLFQAVMGRMTIRRLSDRPSTRIDNVLTEDWIGNGLSQGHIINDIFDDARQQYNFYSARQYPDISLSNEQPMTVNNFIHELFHSFNMFAGLGGQSTLLFNDNLVSKALRVMDPNKRENPLNDSSEILADLGTQITAGILQSEIDVGDIYARAIRNAIVHNLSATEKFNFFREHGYVSYEYGDGEQPVFATVQNNGFHVRTNPHGTIIEGVSPRAGEEYLILGQNSEFVAIEYRDKIAWVGIRAFDIEGQFSIPIIPSDAEVLFNPTDTLVDTPWFPYILDDRKAE